MKCPSCSAHLKPTASRCGKCGHQFDKGSAKKTMMGLPAMDQGNEGAQDEPTKEFDRSTLFGIPAASDGGDDDAAGMGLAEGTAPATTSADTRAEGSAATQVVSDLDVDAVLGGDATDDGRRSTAMGRGAQRSTAAGIPAADDDAGGSEADDNVASAWGLDENSSEADSPKTQVAGAALADAILESKQGAGGFSRSGPESDADDNIKGTLMGMTREQLAEQGAVSGQDATQEVDRSKLEGLSGYSSSEQTVAYDDDDVDDSTQALAPEELERFEKDIQSDRRRQLLSKLRSGSKDEGAGEDKAPASGRNPMRETARGVPSAPSKTSSPSPSQSAPASTPSPPSTPSAAKQSATPPTESSAQKPPSKPAPKSKPPGPKFSIPTPSKDKPAKGEGQQAGSVPEIEVEPMTPAEDSSQGEGGPDQQRPGLGVGKTSFPIPTGQKASTEAQPPAGDDELELALGDTGVLSEADDAALQSHGQQSGPGVGGGGQIHEFVDDEPAQPDQAGQGSGIREFQGDGDDGQSIFPIDDPGQAGPAESSEGVAAQPEPSQPQRASVPSGETPLPVPSSGPVGQQGGANAAPNQSFDHQQLSPQAAQRPAAPTAQQDSTEKLVRTVQVLFGLLGGVFLLGASAFGFVTGSTEETLQVAAITAPAVVGLLTLIVSLVPISGGAKTGSYFAMAALAIAALVAGAVLSAPLAVLLVVFGGVLLVLCAGVFPLVLKVIQ